jgi:GT2 family glycosyltransferase
MIHTYVPYCPSHIDGGKNLGFAYNNFMKMIGEDDWACFLDHDAMFTTPDWYRQLEVVIEKYPDAGEFSVRTNRIGNAAQLYTDPSIPNFSHNHNLKMHRRIGAALQKQNTVEVIEYTKKRNRGLSGLTILTSKRAWKLVGGFSDGFLGVDWDYTFRCANKGLKNYILRGVYVYHWYREKI